MVKFDQLSSTIGNTPIVALPNLFEDEGYQVVAKVEYLNPGLSVKDRIALNIINKAEQDGLLKPKGTIIECSSGNTGVGLSIIAAERGYRFVCFMTDQHSLAKIELLKIYGAEVVICDGSVSKDHPLSAHSKAHEYEQEHENCFWVNQYANQQNPQAHFETTGKEIWEQTEGKITHLISSASTGGTISGCAKYLKTKNPNIKVWGADSYGSAFQHFHKTGVFNPDLVHSYKAENVGKKFIPDTLNFALVDEFIKVTDKDAALMAREAARKQGLLMGYSSGATLQVAKQMRDQFKKGDLIVVICPDHGSRYGNTIYSDQWMREQNFLEPVIEEL